MNNKGILNEKLKNYYEDADLASYRRIFLEAVVNYRGNKFDKVLDIGAGIGSFLDSIKPFNFSSFALEASEYGLKRLREKNINSLEFFLENNKRLPFQDNEFSLVLFNQVIEHLEKNTGEYYIKEIIRVLEPGGVAIVKSPSKYTKIWRTDPHHIYCWKPFEPQKEVEKYEKDIAKIILHRVTLEPWMMVKYNPKIIDAWHKYNKYPVLRIFFKVCSKILNVFVFNVIKSDRMLASSDVTFVKKYDKLYLK